MRAASDLGDLRRRGSFNQHSDQVAQKLRQPAQEQAEVVAGGGEHGVDAVAVAALKIVAVLLHPAKRCGDRPLAADHV